MVENQLRPNKIKDPMILSLFKKIPKEYLSLVKKGFINKIQRITKLIKIL